MGDFNDLYRVLGNIPHLMAKAERNTLKKGAAVVMGAAKKKLGTYQGESGGYKAWVKLKPETVRKKHMSKTKAGALTRAGKRYKEKHGAWGAGGNDDSPLVDSGSLRQAITTDEKQINKGVAYVGVASGSSDSKKGDPGSYAAAHEFGYEPKNIPARPFLRPALHENRDQIKEIAKKEIIKSLRRL
ncbi:hypothetical protein EGH10_20925 [Brevibacillus laterosporus]|uniref:Phage protein n=2 Tax=Brevibacillus laterosporus TaxID=1465 RepID=A0A075R4F3_BRELA|nr:hypothetical protein [Brevibacillus laterosporus]AIG27422.1 phage protein [Brevibacillus laterosporus LMG 15441]RJL15352.1 hypothetical protein DM460_00190 [Brevibacillus laterosporus]TPH06484.1 hypothetical protein EGH10_20925 [Brevibacillus laterosporus]